MRGGSKNKKILLFMFFPLYLTPQHRLYSIVINAFRKFSSIEFSPREQRHGILSNKINRTTAYYYYIVIHNQFVPLASLPNTSNFSSFSFQKCNGNVSFFFHYKLFFIHIPTYVVLFEQYTLWLSSGFILDVQCSPHSVLFDVD